MGCSMFYPGLDILFSRIDDILASLVIFIFRGVLTLFFFKFQEGWSISD